MFPIDVDKSTLILFCWPAENFRFFFKFQNYPLGAFQNYPLGASDFFVFKIFH